MMKNNKHVDEKLKKALLKQTEIEPELKNQTWDNISQELFSSDPPRKMAKRRKKLIAGVAAAAFIMFLTIGLMTETGQAMIQNLRDLFLDEKEEEIEIEGQKEQSNVQLETNEELRYVIYLDDERYRMEEGDDRDRIVTKEPLDDMYPDVYMEIWREEETTTEAVLDELKEILGREGLEITEEARVEEPLEAEMIQGMGEEATNEHGNTGQQWDTPIHRYYVTDTEEEQVFIIKQAYFLEAAEGHGARFDYMLESFEVVK